MKMDTTIAVEVIEGDGSTGRIKLGCDKSGIGDKGCNACIKNGQLAAHKSFQLAVFLT